MQSDLEGTGRNFTICRRIADSNGVLAEGGGRGDREVIKDGRILLCTNKESAASDLPVLGLMLPLQIKRVVWRQVRYYISHFTMLVCACASYQLLP